MLGEYQDHLALPILAMVRLQVSASVLQIFFPSICSVKALLAQMGRQQAADVEWEYAVVRRIPMDYNNNKSVVCMLKISILCSASDLDYLTDLRLHASRVSLDNSESTFIQRRRVSMILASLSIVLQGTNE